MPAACYLHWNSVVSASSDMHWLKVRLALACPLLRYQQTFLVDVNELGKVLGWLVKLYPVTVVTIKAQDSPCRAGEYSPQTLLTGTAVPS